MLKHTVTALEAVKNQVCPGLVGLAAPGAWLLWGWLLPASGRLLPWGIKHDDYQIVGCCFSEKKTQKTTWFLTVKSAARGKIPATSPSHSRWHQHLVKITAMPFLLAVGRRYGLLN